MASGEDRAAASSVEVAAVAAAAVGGVAPDDERVAGESMEAMGDVGGGSEVRGGASGDTTATGENEAETGGGSRVDSGEDATGSGGGATGSGGGATGTPPTPTIEELLVAVEWAGDERGDDASRGMTTAGRVVATPILRTTMVEPRSEDSEIRASRPVPFVAGDFLDLRGRGIF